MLVVNNSIKFKQRLSYFVTLSMFWLSKLQEEETGKYIRHRLTSASAQSGAGCSKLTTSLVNVSLKFKTLILQIHCYFLLEKCENLLQCKRFSHFSNKNNSVFDNVVSIYLKR